ncbi:hypothetical protein OUZ56_030017 [Daphnia magna]|uniref:Uncharacterized protein n=1 Tax=Daphnia magna TaxID=35525 RepID=A0ABR0B8I4_9CRUS|nr:hypothetical protein OUZ56_030017 [Daphnia magna]
MNTFKFKSGLSWLYSADNKVFIRPDVSIVGLTASTPSVVNEILHLASRIDEGERATDKRILYLLTTQYTIEHLFDSSTDDEYSDEDEECMGVLN